MINRVHIYPLFTERERACYVDNKTTYYDKKAKAFHNEIRQFIHSSKPDKTVKDQLSRASFSIALNIA